MRISLRHLAFLLPLAAVCACLLAIDPAAGDEDHHPFLAAPIWVYNNWSVYDELSDDVKLTEALTMEQLGEVERLQRAGVRIDYYLMDAFWFAPDGGYRTWRTEEWPEGPDRWLAALKAHGIKPGLWFGANTLTQIEAAPAWRSSLHASGHFMAFYGGGFLADFMDVLQYWYDRGIRLFKIDFVELGVALAADEGRLDPAEIHTRNTEAFRNALRDFRRRNPDSVFIAFNGFGGDLASTAGPFPFEYPVDLQWLDVFDALFPGDPRPADVPQMDFWRAMDIYTDHMVRRFNDSGVPLERIDSTGFMIGDTATNFGRRTGAWRGMLLLLAARGGWINTIYGNLDFLDDGDAKFLARVQRLYTPLQTAMTTRTFGGVPGEAEPYGFVSTDATGALYTVVNPAQRVAAVPLPPTPAGSPGAGTRVLFRDAGFEPALVGDGIQLGPGQLALVGTGRYADPRYDLGIEDDILIPRRIEPLSVEFGGEGEASNVIETSVMPPAKGDLRIVLQQRDLRGAIVRSFSRRNMGEFFTIEAEQDGKELPVEIRYDKRVWSGLSWAVGEISHGEFAPGKPVRLRLSSAETRDPVTLEGRIYRIEY
jgi:hypothetical protein